MRFLELKIPPAIIFLLFAAGMWGISYLFPGLDIDFFWKREITLVLFAVGGVFGVGGLLEFFRFKTSIEPTDPGSVSTLVTTGVYRVSRNPMYLALLFALAGWAVYLSNPLNVLFPIGFVVYMNRFQIIPEERVLAKKFGDGFSEYRQSVRRWI